MFLSPSYRENILKVASIQAHQWRKSRVWFRAQDIFQGATTQIQVYINIFIFIYMHLTSLALSIDKSAKHTMVVSISLNILASHFRVWRAYSRQWPPHSTVVNLMILMMIMNLYSAKTIEEHSKALYIKLKIPQKLIVTMLW